jgi:hypothetical protein
MADVLRAERRYTEAEKLSRVTLAAMQGVFPEDDPRLVRAQANYARLIEDRDRLVRPKKLPVNSLR